MENNISTTRALIGIIVVLVIIIIAQAVSCSYDPYGLWTADSSFLDDAGLNNMSLLIGDPIKKTPMTTTYNGYLYADNDEGAVEDQRIEISLTPMISKESCKWYTMKVDNVNSWDGKLKLRICPKKHLLTVLSDDTIYAELYKDNILTDYAKSVD